MRILPAFVIYGVVIVLCSAGCSKDRAARIEAPEAKPPDRSWVESADRLSSTAATQHKGTAWEALRRKSSGEQAIPVPAARPPRAWEEITRRAGNTFREWEDYRLELATAVRPHTTISEAAVGIADKEHAAERVDLQSAMAAKRRHSAEYFNWQIRVALLESRLAAASESERTILGEKLERAKAALRAVDEICEAEARSSSELEKEASSKPSDAAEPVHP